MLRCAESGPGSAFKRGRDRRVSQEAMTVSPQARSRSLMSGITVFTILWAMDIQMRMHIELDNAIVGEIDAIAGPRRRSAFVREAILDAVERHRRTSRLSEAAGVLRDSEHEWDDDPAAWVSRQRSGDPRRIG